jgi:hypothetical protein
MGKLRRIVGQYELVEAAAVQADVNAARVLVILKREQLPAGLGERGAVVLAEAGCHQLKFLVQILRIHVGALLQEDDRTLF